MLFSIVIPIFNAEEYLKKCVNSVLEQSFQDWELILVNDGSTDKSGAIIDQFVAQDKRIRAIHKNNKGQLSARRSGIEIARGEYLLFMDSDDYWFPNCLLTLFSIVEKSRPDVIMFPAKREGPRRSSSDFFGKISEEQVWITKEKFYDVLISETKYNSLCLKAWRKSLFDGDETDYRCFFSACWGEDRVQLLYPITKASNIYYIPDVLYCYVDNPTSVTHTLKINSIPTMISNEAFLLLYNYVQIWNMDLPEYREAIAVQYLRNFVNTYYKVRRTCKTKSDRQEFRKYPWQEVLSQQAFRYMFSKKLTWRYKVRLILARYCKI